MKYYISVIVGGGVVGCAIVVGGLSVGGIVGATVASAVAIIILVSLWIAILANGNTP